MQMKVSFEIFSSRKKENEYIEELEHDIKKAIQKALLEVEEVNEDFEITNFRMNID